MPMRYSDSSYEYFTAGMPDQTEARAYVQAEPKSFYTLDQVEVVDLEVDPYERLANLVIERRGSAVLSFAKGRGIDLRSPSEQLEVVARAGLITLERESRRISREVALAVDVESLIAKLGDDNE